MDVIKKEIERIVDVWTNEILNDILSSKAKPRGIWDRMKGSLSNIWYGRDNKRDNPYYWKNKFGDELGVKESFDPRCFTLKEYSILKNILENTEKKLNEELDPEVEKLRIVKTIKNYAQQLKKQIYDLFIKSNSASASTSSPVVAPDASTKEDPKVQQNIEKKDKSKTTRSSKSASVGSGEVVKRTASVKAKKAEEEARELAKAKKAEEEAKAKKAEEEARELAKAKKAEEEARELAKKTKIEKSTKETKKSAKAKKAEEEAKAKKAEEEKEINNTKKAKEEERLLLSSLYENKDFKEIIANIRKKIIMPIARKLDNDQEKINFSVWWNGFKEKAEKDWDLEALVSLIKTKEIFNLIKDNLENEEIKNKDFLDFLKY